MSDSKAMPLWRELTFMVGMLLVACERSEIERIQNEKTKQGEQMSVDGKESWIENRAMELFEEIQRRNPHLSYKEIDISKQAGLRDEMIKKANGMRTIPQIFFDDHHVGGYVELRELEKNGELSNLLK